VAPPLDPETLECPYEFHRRLRRDAPVAWVPEAGCFVVSRWEDVRRVALDPERFSSNLVAALYASPEVRALRSPERGAVDVLATADPPAHTRQRRLVNRTFNAHRVARLEPAIRALTDELVAAFRPDGRVEWMRQLAVPLPVTVIADVLELPRADVPRLREWSDHGIALLSGAASDAEFLAHVRGVAALHEYLRARVTAEEESPGGGLVGDLVRATREGEERLRPEEVTAILVQLLVAGNETTTSLIGSAALLLAERPDLVRALRAAPGRIPDFVEEALRLESPFQGLFRVATRATELGGVPIPAGARLMLLWGSANRDETVFADAAAADVTRPNLKEHLAFGEGIHYCVGAPLARLETRVALEALVGLRGVRLAPGWVPRHVPSMSMRRLVSLDLVFDRD
jgi:cytochrome P450